MNELEYTIQELEHMEQRLQKDAGPSVQNVITRLVNVRHDLEIILRRRKPDNERLFERLQEHSDDAHSMVSSLSEAIDDLRETLVECRQ